MSSSAGQADLPGARTRPAPASGEATSQFLDLSRWLAAFVVVLSHVRSLVLANYGEVSPPPAFPVKMLYFVTGLGHMAVVVFFVISGFLVGGGTIIKAAQGRYSIVDYALHRTVRIYLVLLPALALGLLLDKAGCVYFNNSGIYTGHSVFHVWSIDYSIAGRLGFGVVLGNVASLQTIAVPALGSNGPLWSLANEWWYYVLFACALSAWFLRSRRVRLACCIAMATAFALLPLAITLWFTIWLMGAGVALLARRWRGWPAPFGVAVFLLIVLAERVVLQRMGSPNAASGMWLQYLLDAALALGFSLALLCAGNGRWAMGGRHRFLASFSYTVYLIHFPAMVFIVAVCADTTGLGIGMQPDALGFAFLAALIAVLYLCAWALASLTELHTAQVRRWLQRRIGERHFRPAGSGSARFPKSVM